MAKDRAVHRACFLFPHLGLKREKCLRFLTRHFRKRRKLPLTAWGPFIKGFSSISHIRGSAGGGAPLHQTACVGFLS